MLTPLFPSLIMEPGWSPLSRDPRPYLQVDFLEPTWVSGVVIQGSQRMWGYLTKYRLAFALHASLFNDYTETGTPGSPAKVLPLITHTLSVSLALSLSNIHSSALSLSHTHTHTLASSPPQDCGGLLRGALSGY